MRTVPSPYLVVLTVGLLSCSPAGEGTGSADSSLSRVEARGDAASVLLAQGGKLVADYGSFKLIDVAPGALAQVPPEQVTLRNDYFLVGLNAGAIDTSAEQAQALRGIAVPKSGREMHLIQFAGPIQPKWYEALGATGVRIVAYIPENAYLVYGDAAAFEALQVLAAEPFVQWDGAYLPGYKVNPSVHDVKAEGYQVQLVEDEEANPETLASLGGEGVLSPAGIDHSLGYTNFVARISKQAALGLASRPDVVSIYPWATPQKLDERQDRIISGFLDASGVQPSGPGYLAWLESKGFGPATFGFGVDVSDDGLDNATLDPDNFALHELGLATNPGRVMYARCEGTCSVVQGCYGHGNLNAHIIGGYVGPSRTGAAFRDAAGYAYGLGVAPWVKVGSSVIFGPGWSDPDYEDLQSRAYADGARVSSNSWGMIFGDFYNTDCQRYDALVRDAQPTESAVPAAGNQGMVIVFAAGNSGPSIGSVHPPGTAKNIITAGASENYHLFGGADGCSVDDSEADSAMDMASFSSRGPASDNRKKPDLSAPGTHVSGGVFQEPSQNAEPPAYPNGQANACFTASSVCAGPGSNFWPTSGQWTTASSGTSHSTPAIAGASALVRQWYLMQGNPDPSPALVKATLMATARYMTGTGANDNLWSNRQGMGQTDIGRAFDDTQKLVRDQEPLDVFTATGQTRVIPGSVDDVSKPFRVTLAWTDAPGSTTGSAYNNDLNLTVTVGGNTYLGNVFSGAFSATGGWVDIRNNVESVFLPAGTSGPYTLTITAANINSDGIPNAGGPLDQDFALVIYNGCDDAPPAPANVVATASAPNVIDLAWDDNGAPGYVIYRSFTSGGPYTRVGSTPAGVVTFSDTTVSGGSTYHYVVHGMLCTESSDSNEASATATGTCTLPPTFAGIGSVTNAQQSSCTLDLSWTAATPVCGGTLTYDVYRSRTSGFTPGISNRVATGVTGTTFSDAAYLVQGAQYYYVVRAVETAALVVGEQNTVQKSNSPTGLIVRALDYFDDFDTNRPANAAAYWSHSGTDLLSLVTDCHWQSSSTSYKFGALGVCGDKYTNNASSYLSLGGDGTVDPAIDGFAFPAGSVCAMTFRHWFYIESKFDGARLMYSTAGPLGPWTYVTDSVSTTAPYISAGRYTGTASSAGGARVWTGTSGGDNGAERAVTVNLNALAGQTAWFALHFTSDSSLAYEGHYLDDVQISADLIGACTPFTTAVSYSIDLPPSAPAGVSTPFTISARDVGGALATGYAGTANVSVQDPQGVVSTPIAFENGVASGAVTFGTTGSQPILAVDSVTPSIQGTGSTTVIPGPVAALAIQTQPSETVAGEPISPVQVRLVDAYGNPVSSAADPVTIAIGNNAGGGTLSGTLTVNAAGGVATFPGLSIEKAGGGYTLIATSGALTSATTDPFDILPAAPAMAGIITQPSAAQAGEAIAPAIQVGIFDPYGNLTAGNAEVTIQLASNPGGAWLGGTTDVMAVNGVATFSDLWLSRVGTGYTLLVSCGALVPVLTNPFDILPGDPYGVAFRTQPADRQAGVPFSPVVTGEVLDAYGNRATQYNGLVYAGLLNGGSARLLGTTTVTASAGLATFFNLAVDKVGNGYALTLTGPGIQVTSSNSFNITAGPPTTLAFTGQPSRVQAGAVMTPAVRVAVQDAYGNSTVATNAVTLAFGTNPGGGTLGGTLTVNAVGGVATFANLTVNRTGTGYALRATGSGLAAATSSAFDVFAGAAASLEYAVQPSNAVAGASLAPSVQVRALDAQGNVATDFTHSVGLALSSNPGGATVSGDTAAVAVNGVALFSGLSLDKVGTGYRFTASSGALPTVESDAFDIGAAATSRLVFGAEPQDGVAGTALAAVQVRAEDRFGNLTPAFAGTVRLALEANPYGAALGGTLQQAAVAGVATFADLMVNKAGTGYAIDASSSGLPTTGSSTFDIAAAAGAALAYLSEPVDTRAGVALSPAVRVVVLDAYGNVVTTSAMDVTVGLGQNPGAGLLSGTATQAVAGGVATFADLSIDKAGAGYTLVASGAGVTSATSRAFDVTPGAPDSLELVTQPSNASAGAAISPAVRVRVRDALGNTDVTYSGVVSLTLADEPPGVTLGGDISVNAVGGVATFIGLTVDKVGTGYRLAATSGSLLGATSATFDIGPAAAASLRFRVDPSNVVAGAHIAPAVEVEALDAFGNVAAGFAGNVRVALQANGHDAALAGTTSTGAIAGVASFGSLSVARAGAGYSLVASSTGLSPVSSATFDVSAGVPTHYELVGLPASVTVSVETVFSVRALDASGNLSTDYAGTATVSSTDSSLSKPTSVSFGSGQAAGVPVTFHATGVQSITVTDSADAALTATASTTVTSFPQPTVRITSPAAGDEVGGVVTVTAEGAVASGTTLSSISISVDGIALGSGNVLPFAAQWDTNGLEKRSAHQISAVIQDAAGNIVQAVPVAVTIAQTGCGCGAVSGGEGSILFGVAMALQLIRRRRRAK